LDVGVRTGYGFRSYKTLTDGLIAVCEIDASEVVFDSGGDKRAKCVLNTADVELRNPVLATSVLKATCEFAYPPLM
jgi:hypothetical protein